MNLQSSSPGVLVCFVVVLLAIYFLSEAHIVIVLALGVMSMMMGVFLCADLFARWGISAEEENEKQLYANCAKVNKNGSLQ